MINGRWILMFGFALAQLVIVGNELVCGQDVQPKPSSLSIDRIFKQNEFRSANFRGRWIEGVEGYEVVEAGESQAGPSIVRYSLDAEPVRTVAVPATWLKSEGMSKPIGIASYAWSADQQQLLIFTNTRRVWRQNTRGDYWVLDIKSHHLRQLGKSFPESSLMFAKFAPDGRTVAYVHDRNIYLEDLATAEIKALTHGAAETITCGTFDWVYEEELNLRDGFRFSSDGKSIAFWEIDSSGIEPFYLVNNTDSLYPKLQPIAYPKVGTTNPAARIGVVDLDSAQVTWIKIDGDPREHYLARMSWVKESRKLLIQQLNRLQNRNRLLLVDVDSGQCSTVFDETDEAWVDVHDDAFFLADGLRFTWTSERTGWRQIELVDLASGSRRAITPGGFDVIEVLGVDEVNGWVYYLASPDNATRKSLFRSPLAGGEATRVSPQEPGGSYRYDLSPDGQWAITTFSSADQPPRVDLIRLSDHACIRTLEDNRRLAEKFAAEAWPRFEFFRVTIEPGVELDAWSLMPKDFDPLKKYPLIVFVYGEPAGQTVLDTWGGERSMWHRMLAQQGYVVMSFDNRGTPAPRGRQWRKSIYRQIGILASADQATAVKSILADRPYIDAKRVGVWGWSGGGSMTLNAMFRYPELYAVGVSVAPVPNQLYYDTIYQERYMGLPADNVDGYRDGSPIHFARQLKGKLLLIHGTGDDNCHYQTSELLINELIRRDKQFEMFAYPNRSHAIAEGPNTTPHLFQQITEHFQRHLLLANPSPATPLLSDESAAKSP